MAINGKLSVSLDVRQTGSHDLGTPVLQILQSLLADITSGTGDGQFDVAFGDARTPGGTSEALDLSGSLTDVFGASFAPVEVGCIIAVNRNTSGQLQIGGAASNQAYAGLFAAANDILVVGPAASSAIPAFAVWYAPKDGGGLVVTGSTADQLKILSSSGNLDYSILILGRSA